MNFIQSMDYINSFSHSGKKVTDLSRIAGLLKLLGNPQKKLKFVHIAGTNGKGSVLEYCSNAYIFSGFKTGQFTSPYILNYCDRIRINGKNISEERTAEICTQVRSYVNSDFYSQFEISFAIALIYFLEEKCDIVFLETGIGGTLDATNIIENPLASVITSISFDHTAILGNTIEDIAMHKLGIIKENCLSLISCDNSQTVTNLAKAKAIEKNSRLIIPDKTKCVIKKSDIYGSEFIYKGKNYKLKMCGMHQIINALTSIEVLENLKPYFTLNDENTFKSFSQTVVGSRIELIGDNPKIIIDGGHNEAGINSLMEFCEKNGINDAVGIFGMIKGKPLDFAVESLSKIFKKVYCVDDFADNSFSEIIIANKFKKNNVDAVCSSCESSFKDAYIHAKKSNRVLLVCGSLYLASHIKASDFFLQILK